MEYKERKEKDILSLFAKTATPTQSTFQKLLQKNLIFNLKLNSTSSP